MNSKTFEALQKLKVDCLYKKSTHSNAARRLQKDSQRFKIYLIIGSALASISVIMNIGVWDSMKTPQNYNYILFIQIVFNIVGALGALFVLYASSFSDYYNKMEQAKEHEQVSVDLNHTFKKIRNVEAFYVDKQSTDDELKQELNKLTEEYIRKTKYVPITEEIDFLRAREDFKKGYLTGYGQDELES